MNALQQIASDEGFRSSAYQDSEGLWTIGYGTLIDASMGAGITKAEAEILLRNRIAIAEAELTERYPWVTRLSPDVYGALVNMAYNLGISRLNGFEKMLAALKSGDYAEAKIQALDSKWARQVGQRANRIADIFESAA